MFKTEEQMTTPIMLQHCQDEDVSGGSDREYINAKIDPIIFCNFKTKGGTKVVHNGKLIILDTATVTMWYRDDIKASDRFILLDDGSAWDIISPPENLERRNQKLIITVQCAGGGA